VLFLTTWRTKSGNRDKAVERFAKTGGMPPAGVKMLGRWHAVTQNMGVTVAEADNAEQVAKWCYEWSDILEFEVVPVLDDAAAARVFGG